MVEQFFVLIFEIVNREVFFCGFMEDVKVVELLATFVTGLVPDFLLFLVLGPLAEITFNFDGHLEILWFVCAVLEKEALSVEIITTRRF
jgi:hypothetical protein